MFCKKCGFKLSVEQKFCGQCGDSFSNRKVDKIQDVEVVLKKLNKRKNIYLIAPVVSFFVILSLYGVVYFVGRTLGVSNQSSTLLSVLNMLIPIFLALLVLFIPVGIVLGLNIGRKMRKIKNTDEYDERSGEGENSIIPEEIKGWSWGAMGLTWIWGLSHGVYRSLLVFVPIFNIVYIFILGAKGREWAWRSGKYKDVEEFRESQKVWDIVGALLIGAIIIFSVMGFSSGERETSVSQDDNASKASLIAEIVEQVKADTILPSKMDDVTTLIDVTAEPTAIRYYYHLTGIDSTEFSNDLLKSLLLDGVCGDEAIKNLLNKDINVEYSYLDVDTEKNYFTYFSKQDCSLN